MAVHNRFTSKVAPRMAGIAAVLAVLGAGVWAYPGLGPPQVASSSANVAVPVLATVESSAAGQPVPALHAADVYVRDGGARVQALDALAGKPLQLAVLIDDSCDPRLGANYPELRSFILQQTPATAVGVGYLRNGSVVWEQRFTPDHQAAAQALRLPVGQAGISPSPYTAISWLLKHWPEQPGTRRVIVLFSHGIDLLGGYPSNPYLDRAVDTVQRAQVPVYAIYASPSASSRPAPALVHGGQNSLSQIGEKSGGASYFLGLRQAVNYGSYLNDVNAKLARQYEVTVAMPARNKAGFRSIGLGSEYPAITLVTSKRIYVPAGR